MKKVLIQIEKCIQDIQELGSNEEFMISRIFLNLLYPNKNTISLIVDIKQTAGSDYESYPLEVILPKGKKLKVNYDQFREIIEKYYRSLVGSTGRRVRIQGASKTRMFNNTFNMPAQFEVEFIKDDTLGW